MARVPQQRSSEQPSSRWGRTWLVAPAIALAVALAACSNADPVETPTPGGTSAPSPDATVRAPNGTNMGAPPINAGTAAP